MGWPFAERPSSPAVPPGTRALLCGPDQGGCLCCFPGSGLPSASWGRQSPQHITVRAAFLSPSAGRRGRAPVPRGGHTGRATGGAASAPRTPVPDPAGAGEPVTAAVGTATCATCVVGRQPWPPCWDWGRGGRPAGRLGENLVRALDTDEIPLPGWSSVLGSVGLSMRL